MIRSRQITRGILLDVVGLAGLGMMTWGLWQWSPPLAGVVVGSLLVGLAVWAARSRITEG